MKAETCAGPKDPRATIGFSLAGMRLGIMTNPENDHIWLRLNPFSMINACFMSGIRFDP